MLWLADGGGRMQSAMFTGSGLTASSQNISVLSFLMHTKHFKTK